MVARIAIFLLATIILSDLYIYVRFFRKPHKHSWPMHVLMWGSSAVIMIFTCVLSLQRNFAPLNLTWLNVYLFLLVVFLKAYMCFAPSSAYCCADLLYEQAVNSSIMRVSF